MKRKYKTLVAACTAAGYPRLRALSRKVGDRRQWRSQEGFTEACNRRGTAVVDLIDNHSFSQSEIARLLGITETAAGRIYNTFRQRVNA